MSDSRNRALLGPLLVAAAILACFASVLVGRCFLGGDFVGSFEPLAQALADGIRHGDVLRTQRLFNGLPLLAHPVVAACYPPQLLVALGQPARVLTLLSLAHLIVAGVGACILLRRLGSSHAGACAGALAFALSGAAVSSMTQPNLVRALAWLPGFLLLADASARPARGRGIAATVGLAFVTTMLLLTGEPFIVLPAFVAFCALLLPRPGETLRGRIGLSARVATGAFVAALLALPLLLPGALYARASVRAAGFVPEVLATWSLHPAQALGLMVPRPFGDPWLAGLDGFAARALVSGRSNEYFLSMYLGALVLGLAAAGIACGGRPQRRALAAIIVLTLLALGAHGPAQPILDALGVDWLRYPVKWLLPAMLPLAILVARGADALGDDGVQGRRARGMLVAAALLPAAAALFAGPLGRFVASCAPDGISATARAVVGAAARDRFIAGGTWAALVPLLLLAALVLLRRAGRSGLAPLAPALAALALALDLGVQAHRTLPSIESDFYRKPAPAASALLRESPRGRTWIDRASTRDIHPLQPVRTMQDIVSWQRELLMNYTAAASGLDLAFPVDVEALAPLRIQDLSDVAASAAWRERLMLLGAAGVTHVVTMSEPGSEFVLPFSEIPTSAGVPLRLLRNRLALPRVRMVPAVHIHHGAGDFVAILREAPPDLFARETLVGSDDWERFVGSRALPPAGGLPGWSAHARIVAEKAGALDVEVDGDGGSLVVSDAWLPGTSASIDGEEAVAFPADHAFTGVLVPAGRHAIRIAYDPWTR